LKKEDFEPPSSMQWKWLPSDPKNWEKSLHGILPITAVKN
jgi:hypothetical protein